jgi:hypothetical protein
LGILLDVVAKRVEVNMTKNQKQIVACKNLGRQTLARDG